MDTEMDWIEAAGRTISTRNADRIREAFVGLGKILAEIGAIDKTVFDQMGLNSNIQPINASGHKIPSFSETVSRNTWDSNLREAQNIFQSRLEMCLGCDENLLSEPREEITKKLIAEYKSWLESHAQSHPGTYNASPMRLAADSSEPEEDFDEERTIANLDSSEPEENDPEVETIEAQAKEVEPQSLGMIFEFPTEICAASRETTNRRPIEGVLFRVDEPSESAPSVGPGYPLYIPRTVAVEALGAVSGLPLDAHDSFAQHSDKDITGVMIGARLEDRDFIVSGYLWDYNQNAKVAAIAAKRDSLGMSMNASAEGHIAEIDGTKVFFIDRLHLLGANILLSEKATYRKTRLLSAQSDSEFVLELGQEQIAAASANDSLTERPQGDDMSYEIIQEELQAIGEQLDSVTELAKIVDKLNSEMNDIKAMVSEIQAEREVRLSALENEKIQASKSEERQSLVETIRTEVAAAVATAINPSGIPPRKTTALVAQGHSEAIDSDDPRAQLENDLNEAEIKLKTIRQHRIDTDERFLLVDQIKAMRQQLGIA